MVRLDHWYRRLIQEGWHNTGYSVEKEFYMTILDLVEESNKSVWKVCIKVWYMNRSLENVCFKENDFVLNENSVKGKPCINW